MFFIMIHSFDSFALIHLFQLVQNVHVLENGFVRDARMLRIFRLQFAVVFHLQNDGLPLFFVRLTQMQVRTLQHDEQVFTQLFHLIRMI